MPSPRPGWRLDLVTQAPTLRHPSVVACAPDGRIFVAEDPMDISLPQANAAEGRILCLFPDGRTTIFADKLFAVFGLQYLEGRLYVLHNPKFSVFDDDQGVGRNRRDLIEQTLPNPSALNWNDHIPANFRLAMDGYFYAACGDKGLLDARGTDGSRATLSSGGVFRIRPDGSALEVFCHGVRNILDVALDAEDEMFTYDNTDEHDWMGRFTHMVEAGFYGYPHDFIPRRPYTLWMMDDYGAGAACGAFAYTEDALPPEFHGNVFLADFGKRQVMRVRVARDGGTFRAVAKEDLFPDPPGDFRPVGITPSPDGLGLYICDWQHRDEKAQVNVGRLFKLTWTGDRQATPKPAWYLPAALGQPFTADDSQLLDGLRHPSHAVRLTAQRRLTERLGTSPTARPGPNSNPARASELARQLRALLTDPRTPTQTRIHALWTLDTATATARALIPSAELFDAADPALRRQAARQAGLRRQTSALPQLVRRLGDSDPSVRFHAATALGRIGHQDAVPPLLAALEELDLFARFATFTALNRIGTNQPTAWKRMVQALDHSNARVREATAFALRETYDEALLTNLDEFVRDRRRSLAARLNALELVAVLPRKQPAWKGEWGAYHPALQPPPARTETWPGSTRALECLRWAAGERESSLRRRAIQALATCQDASSIPTLHATYRQDPDPDTRAAILDALGALHDRQALALAHAELSNPTQAALTRAAVRTAAALGDDASTAVIVQALGHPRITADTLADLVAALQQLRATNSLTSLRKLATHTAANVRAATLRALVALEGAAALPTLDRALDDPDVSVQLAAVTALGSTRSTNAVPSLLRAAARPQTRSAAFFAITRTPDPRCLDLLLEGLGSKNPAERNAAHLAIRDLQTQVLAAVESRAPSLPPQARLELRQIYAGNADAERGPLFQGTLTQPIPEDYLRAALDRPGKRENGARLFADAHGVNCLGCHRVAGQGGEVGPDLSAAGAQFDRRALVEAILEPSRAVREGYQQVIIEMKDGEEWTGLVKGETASTLTLRDSSGRDHALARQDIKARRHSTLSLMPEGLHLGLTLDEFADLIAYLESLRAAPR